MLHNNSIKEVSSVSKSQNKFDLNNIELSLTNSVDNSDFIILKNGTIKQKRKKNSYVERYLNSLRLEKAIENSNKKRVKSYVNIRNKKNLFYKKNFNFDNVNKDLTCPMNFLYDVSISKVRDSRVPIPMSEFFEPVPLDGDKRKSKQVEKMIEKYSLEAYKYNKGEDNVEYLVLQYDFYKMVEDIRGIYLSRNYKGLMSWLIDRAFVISPQLQRNKNNIKTTLNKNRSLLLKTLYTVNPDLFLSCFKEKVRFLILCIAPIILFF